MRRLAWLLPLALFFLNPNLGCGGPEFQYGATEMRAAIEGTWQLTLMPEGASPMQVTVQIAEGQSALPQASATRNHGLLPQAHACGTRTLARAAEACIDLSQMPLEVMLVDGDASFSGVRMSGILTVYGLTFGSGQVELVLGERRVTFTLDSDGIPRGAGLGGQPGTVTVQHTAS